MQDARIVVECTIAIHNLLEDGHFVAVKKKKKNSFFDDRFLAEQSGFHSYTDFE